MTQAPIHPRHKDEAAKAAGFGSYDRTAIGYGSDHSTVKSILAHAQTLANDEAKGKALAEIDRIAKRNRWDEVANETFLKVAAIAAPYRASDPVAEAVAWLYRFPDGATIIETARPSDHDMLIASGCTVTALAAMEAPHADG